jgi:thiol-disulfide isomerase/thioredoxin
MALAASILALLLAGADGSGLPAASHRNGERLAAELAAATALVQLDATDLSGERWTAGDLQGRVMLIDFWATWCAPCLAELPRLKGLRERYGRNEFEILGVSLDASSRLTLVSWLNRNRIDWPQVHERAGYAGRVPRQFGIDRLPRTFLLDRHGRVAALDLRGDRLAEAVHMLVTAPSARLEARK